MMYRILHACHWFLGLTAGLVLVVVGASGAAIAFKDEIVVVASPGIATLPVQDRLRLGPAALVERAAVQRPDKRIVRVTLHSDPARAPEIRFVPLGDGDTEEDVWIDPYDGTLLGTAHFYDTFEFLTRLHRYLALPGNGDGVGRIITGIAALSLVFFAVSGLYLRWPGKPLRWQSWFKLDLKRSGRNLYRSLHAVIGGWMVAFYLLAALTGLWWSYDWYETGLRYALTGDGAEADDLRVKRFEDEPIDLVATWHALQNASAEAAYEHVRIDLPDTQTDAAINVRARIAGGRHKRVADYFVIDGRDGTVLSRDLYRERPIGEDIANSMLELHLGAYFGMTGRVLMTIASALLPLFAVTGILMYITRRRRKMAAGAPLALSGSPGGTILGGEDTLVVFASQTGTAEAIACATAAAFPNATLLSLDELTDQALADAPRALFVISTYGEAEPPDRLRSFARTAMVRPPAAGGLDYAVLALGDHEYGGFCAFGHTVDRWLSKGGGQRLFDTIEMDGDDSDARRLWADRLASLGAAMPAAPERKPALRARLAERCLLNPGSSGREAYLITLAPLDAPFPDWSPGDIVEIEPRHGEARIAAFLEGSMLAFTSSQVEVLRAAELPDPLSVSGRPLETVLADLHTLPARDYSIASIARSGQIDLIVRRCTAADGGEGVASGWLTGLLEEGDQVCLRLRTNKSFHPPNDADAPMILIGNGTGLAGLLSHLRHRAAEGGGKIWLIFGERSAVHDALMDDELRDHLTTGALTRLDRSWSQGEDGHRYVQDILRAEGEVLRDWVRKGAVILVCGGANGMAPAVHAALTEILGQSTVERLLEMGYYRRDVY